MRSNIILLIFAMLMAIIFVCSTPNLVSAEEETTEKDPESNGIVDAIQNFFKGILDAFLSLITAPFKAIASIFGAWAGTLSVWYGPILMAFVLVTIYFMVRVAIMGDALFDLFG